jgi:hypothetical protein
MPDSTLESRVNKTLCVTCGNYFWKWDEDRTQCRQCDPGTPEEVKARLYQINHGTVKL